ncbi:MAG: cytochrome C [Planctomycetes bacterium]|nr:cytochrome C [Planctomycetota bacterium]
MDWHQLWYMLSKPDNVPIVLLLFMCPFYVWMAFSQARKNDRLIAQLEADPELAKTHHRTIFPYQKGWPKTVQVWPFLLKREFLATVIVTIILIVWSICLDAPLEDPANPNLTMNPSKAPWYFLGLQELLVYFDPWIAGVVLPSIILLGLMAIPYIDVNPRGNGYYTWKQRKFAIGTFLFGFLGLWVSMVIIGTFIRGPGWLWFNPGQTWDHHRVDHQVNRDLHEFFGVDGALPEALFGLGFLIICAGVIGGVTHACMKKMLPEMLKRLSMLQYQVLMQLWILQVLVLVKIVLRLTFTVKNVWVTPWFNI